MLSDAAFFSQDSTFLSNILRQTIDFLFRECILVDVLNKNGLASDRRVTSEEAQNHDKEFET